MKFFSSEGLPGCQRPRKHQELFRKQLNRGVKPDEAIAIKNLFPLIASESIFSRKYIVAAMQGAVLT